MVLCPVQDICGRDPLDVYKRQEFVDLNIKLVNFANNHTVDYGWRGCLDTIEEAEARDIEPCGVGRNLSDARKAKFLDTAKGRVSVVAASSTWSDRALGADASADTVARPGLAPLRWGHTYYVCLLYTSRCV